MFYVVSYKVWWGFRPGKFEHYRLEPFCPRCDAMEEEAAQKKRAWGWAAVLTSGAVIFGYGYLSLTAGLTGAGIVGVLCFLVMKRKKVEILPAERRDYGRR